MKCYYRDEREWTFVEEDLFLTGSRNTRDD
jgi:hypothetical protein